MIPRYDMITDLNLSDDAAIMYRQIDGEFIKYDDAEFVINQLRDGLKHLKDCRITINTPEELNLYINNLLELTK